jgi:RNA polymerase sigma factor (sigma-70 family)
VTNVQANSFQVSVIPAKAFAIDFKQAGGYFSGLAGLSMGIENDLSVACQAMEGNQEAIMKVRSELSSVLGVLLSKCRDKCSEEKAREIADSLPADLIVGVPRDGKNVPLLKMYQGRAPLRSWLTVVALSRLKSWWRSPQYRNLVRTRDEHDDRDFTETLAAAGTDSPGDSEIVAILSDALAEALGSLSSRASVILRLVHIHDVEQQRLAVMLSCHAATISRELAQTQEGIRRQVMWGLKILDPYLDITWDDCISLLEERPGLISEAL